MGGPNIGGRSEAGGDNSTNLLQNNVLSLNLLIKPRP